MMRALLLIPVLLLGACTTQPPVPPTSLRPPSSALMRKPADLPPVQAGDSLYVANAVCRREYGALSSQVRGLQNWAAVVTRAKR